MRLALREAAKAAAAGEVPAGCVIVARPTDTLAPPMAAHVLARAHNQTELLKDPTAHAEMIAITQAAAAVQDWRLVDTILYVTKEPCPLCWRASRWWSSVSRTRNAAVPCRSSTSSPTPI